MKKIQRFLMQRKWNKHLRIACDSTSEEKLFKVGMYYLEKYKKISKISKWMKCWVITSERDHIYKVPLTMNYGIKFPDWIPILDLETNETVPISLPIFTADTNKFYVYKVGDNPYLEASIIFKCLFENEKTPFPILDAIHNMICSESSGKAVHTDTCLAEFVHPQVNIFPNKNKNWMEYKNNIIEYIENNF